MHGKNIVRKAERNPDGALQVHEVFYTLQGEGPLVGHPAVFVRLTGCNLRCWFCDTHWNDEKDKTYCVTELVKLVEEEARAGTKCVPCKLVVITGGEPLRQYLYPFIMLLIMRGYTVQIETAGTLWQEELAHVRADKLLIVVSPKTAKIHEEVYLRACAFKYVIRAGRGLGGWNTQRKNALYITDVQAPRPGAPVYLSPCDEEDKDKNKANLKYVRDLALMTGAIAGVQLHKILNIR